MKSTVLWSLIVLNVALVASLVFRIVHVPAANAQQTPMQRAMPGMGSPGDYLAIPADFTGAVTGVVVVVDQNAEELSAISYDDANRRFDSMLKIELKPLFAAGAANNPRTR